MIRERTEELISSGEQQRYADVLAWGTRAGFAVLSLSFLAYVLGWLEPQVSFARLPELWSQPAASYLAASGIPTGWNWLGLVHRGDLSNLVGISILAGVSVACLLAVVPAFAARRDRSYVLICAAEVAVLLLAASGLLTAGH